MIDRQHDESEYTLTLAAANKLSAELLTTVAGPIDFWTLGGLDSRVIGAAHIRRYRLADVVAWCRAGQPKTIKDALAAKARAEELDVDSNFYRRMTTPEAVEYILYGETSTASGGSVADDETPAINRALAMVAKVDQMYDRIAGPPSEGDPMLINGVPAWQASATDVLSEIQNAGLAAGDEP